MGRNKFPRIRNPVIFFCSRVICFTEKKNFQYKKLVHNLKTTAAPLNKREVLVQMLILRVYAFLYFLQYFLVPNYIGGSNSRVSW